jgi:predicted nucleic-acid-binding protein
VISLDTNVIVRVATADDPEQLGIALEVMRSNHLYICKTVLLETEWVLRYTYRLPRKTILEVFSRLLGLSNLSVEDPRAVSLALDLYRGGMDLADAFHVASSGEADQFVTFDRDLALCARRLESAPAVELLGGTPAPA